MSGSNKEIKIRRRRALYRASHRGTKELDILLSRYANALVAGMTPDELTEFEALLECPEPDLQRWLVSLTAPDEDAIPPLIKTVRAFHGLD